MIGAYATDAITRIVPGVLGSWQTPGADTELTVMGRVDLTQRMVRDFKGSEVMAAGKILLDFSPAWNERFRVGGVEYGIAQITPAKAWETSHYEVWLV